MNDKWIPIFQIGCLSSSPRKEFLMECRVALPVGMPVVALHVRSRFSGPSLSSDNLCRNDLLCALTQGELLRLQSNLELIPMPRGQMLYASGGATRHVYFPTTSIVSISYAMEDGACSEIAVVGNAGVLGVPVFMGGGSSPSQAAV